SVKSQTARTQGNANLLGIYNHLNTLYLNLHPRKYGSNVQLKGNPYKGKNILLVDDIATSGYSFDAAKLLLEKAGASKVICFSWLKTINTPLNISTEPLSKDYNVYSPIRNAQNYYADSKPKQIAFSAIIPSHDIGYEMTRLFTDFLQWNEDIL
ncbi:phosphoribosyltransferase, partial [Acinetobacter baumannii]|nr:phosphoribosyltransferase [Acinetobacter baumannii]